MSLRTASSVRTRWLYRQQLARYKNEIERARGSLARGVQVLDRGVRDRTEDMKESIKLGREGLAVSQQLP